MSVGPYLIIGAFWSDTNIVDEVAEALRSDLFPRSAGRRGCVVSMRDEVASSLSFQDTMRRLDMAELNDRRGKKWEAVT